jgi:hypothetical protein
MSIWYGICQCWRQFQDKGATRALRIVPQITSKGSHEGTGQIKAESRRVRTFLQRLKDFLIWRNARSGIRKPN